MLTDNRMQQALIIASNFSEVNVSELKKVYQQNILLQAQMRYPHLSENLQVINAEQDFYSDLIAFFKTPGALYAVWGTQSLYLAALRLEQYNDGYLITSLETAPDERQKGYATSLMRSVFSYLSATTDCRVYSHVSSGNFPSVQLHTKLGFQKHSDFSVFIDGSLHNDIATLFLDIRKDGQ